MDKRRIVITGLGVISPVGNTKDEFWKSLIEGKSGVASIKAFDPDGFTSHIAAEVKGFDPSRFINPKDLKRMDKFVQYAVSASKMALDDAGLDLGKEDLNRIGTVVGSGIGGLYTIEEQYKNLLEKGPSRISPFLIPMLIVNMAPGQISITFGIKGPNSCVATACASGTHAIGDSFKIIQRGEADVMITGGTESCITPLGFGGFCVKLAQLPNN
jgi:3-oxoacyl-[acyl-carrier-protein] synthase II